MDRHLVGLPVVGDIINRISLTLAWHREYARVSAELGAYTRHELAADLRLSRGDIPELAARAADEHVAALSRSRARQPWVGGRHLAATPA